MPARKRSAAWTFDLAAEPGRVVPPLGFDPALDLPDSQLEALLHTDTAGRQAQVAATRQRQAQAIAMAPGKQLFMTAFMLWMSGFHITIFSIMFTGMAVMNPCKSLLNVNQAFKAVDDGKTSLLQWKLVFCALNCVGLAMAAYKCHYMGLLPLYASDWVGLLPIRKAVEFSGAMFVSV
jgi:hypothetical protein